MGGSEGIAHGNPPRAYLLLASVLGIEPNLPLDHSPHNRIPVVCTAYLRKEHASIVELHIERLHKFLHLRTHIHTIDDQGRAALNQ